MRLIDAEALREKILAMPTDGDIVQPFIDKFGVVGTIDAAPTIECETCEHYEDNVYCPRKGESYWAIRHDDFGCSYYEPKEQK